MFLEPDLLIVDFVFNQAELAGILPGREVGHVVYKIKKVSVLHLSGDDTQELNLEPCPLHGVHTGHNLADCDDDINAKPVSSNSNRGGHHGSAVSKTWNTIKSTASHVKSSSSRAIGHVKSGGSSSNLNQLDAKDRFERRLIEEVVKMYNDTDAFYFSPTGDLTNTLQRQFSSKSGSRFDAIDDRFFWNKFMVKDLLELANVHPETEVDRFVIPIIQGFFQSEKCFIDVDHNLENNNKSKEAISDRSHQYQMILISRRSRFRAGTR